MCRLEDLETEVSSPRMSIKMQTTDDRDVLLLGAFGSIYLCRRCGSPLLQAMREMTLLGPRVSRSGLR